MNKPSLFLLSVIELANKHVSSTPWTALNPPVLYKVKLCLSFGTLALIPNVCHLEHRALLVIIDPLPSLYNADTAVVIYLQS